MYCPFRAIKSKMTRKDDDKIKMPLIYYFDFNSMVKFFSPFALIVAVIGVVATSV
jgi:hypothetical protein